MGESHVTVYDSLTPALPHALRCQLANLYRRFAAGIHGRINVHVRCTQRQIGGSDCGLFAIANAVALANGQDPGCVRFHQEQMRPHLLECLDSGNIAMFPHTALDFTLLQKAQVYTISKHCMCYACRPGPTVTCSSCKRVYHMACVTLNIDAVHLQLDNQYLCQDCIT